MEVEKILDMKINKADNSKQYMVKWINKADDLDMTWVLSTDLENWKVLVDDFEAEKRSLRAIRLNYHKEKESNVNTVSPTNQWALRNKSNDKLMTI